MVKKYEEIKQMEIKLNNRLNQRKINKEHAEFVAIQEYVTSNGSVSNDMNPIPNFIGKC